MAMTTDENIVDHVIDLITRLYDSYKPDGAPSLVDVHFGDPAVMGRLPAAAVALEQVDPEFQGGYRLAAQTAELWLYYYSQHLGQAYNDRLVKNGIQTYFELFGDPANRHLPDEAGNGRVARAVPGLREYGETIKEGYTGEPVAIATGRLQLQVLWGVDLLVM